VNSAPVKSEKEEKPKPKAKPIPSTLSQIVESKFRESTIQRKEEKESNKIFPPKFIIFQN
jgi:hypothetical protein